MPWNEQPPAPPGPNAASQIPPARGVTPRTLLELLMRQRDQTQEEAAAQLGISVRHLSRLVRGEGAAAPHQVQPATRRALQKTYGHPAEDLLRPPISVDNRSADGLERMTNRGPAPPPVVGTIGAFSGADMWSLEYSTCEPLAPAAIVERLTGALEQRIATATRRAFYFGTARDASNVGSIALEHLRAEAARLAVAYEQQPLPLVISDIIALQDNAFALLDGHQRPRETSDLYAIAGLASGLLAKSLNDLADPQGAMTHARTAVICSQNADAPNLTAWARGIQCLIAYWAGSYSDTINYAQIGASLPGVTGSVIVWLRSLEARAWAAIGDVQASERMIGLATDVRETLSLSELDRIGGFCYFPHARQLYYAAGANALIPENHSRAEAFALNALEEFDTPAETKHAWSDILGTYTELSLARINASDLDGAAAAIAPVLELPISQRIHGMVVSVRRVHQAISSARFESPIARSLRAEIETYCRTPAISLPR